MKIQLEASPSKKLTFSYIVALSIMGILAILCFFIFHFSLSIKEYDSRFIRIAGQQGMLSQTLVKESLILQNIYNQPNYNTKLQSFENNFRELWRIHEGLIKGDEGLNLPGKKSKDVEKLLNAVESHFQKIRRACEDIISTYDYDIAERKIILDKKINVLLENEEYFQGIMNELLIQYELEAQVNQAILKKVVLVVFGANIIGIFIIGLFVFRPVVKNIAKIFEKINKEKEYLRNLNSELAEAQDEVLENSDELLELNMVLMSTKDKVESALKNEYALRQKTEAAHLKLEQVHTDLEYKNKQIEASINYAQRIQDSLLPRISELPKMLEDSFIFFRPKNVVSGDFYWYFQKDYRTIIAAIDCMGHGVPGAFMSLIGERLLYEAVYIKGLTKASEILNELDVMFKKIFKHDIDVNGDTLDVALCVIDNHPEKLKLFNAKPKVEYAGARNPLIFIQNEEINEIKGDRISIGSRNRKNEPNLFTNHEIELDDNTGYFYIYSDGFQDQFGGPGTVGKKFTKKRLKELFLSIHKLPFEEQKSMLNSELEQWMYEENPNQIQIDDILIIGFKIN
ncbi:SpoIIE family protein phosphatase [Chondrinema litorale]|uniref:SpoIIE family protein phosphatase n=1 Tax=Chondrinema litorale TaxID=2994555 RepID=UPI002542C6F2|nr:SpoIIE family protein phosphatase [Chondrinema litorale]UZR93662.1 type IV pili methyl-accepting chemotaxis transducer N-terminal domain-containing protein [Chondrinema litorale]